MLFHMAPVQHQSVTCGLLHQLQAKLLKAAAASASSDMFGIKAQMPQSSSMRGASPAGTMSPCTSFRRQRTCDDNDVPAIGGAWPQPKWPPNHESAAFEAVAVKKSSILSPPEIYAEMAHHGKCRLQMPCQQQAVMPLTVHKYHELRAA